MANNKNVETKKADTKKEAVQVLSIASVFQKVATEALRGHKEHATKIVKILADNKITERRGFKITVEKVAQQCSAMCRDIKQERGKQKNSWWANYIVEEKDGSYKIVPKPKLTV